MDEGIESLKERGWRQVAAIDEALARGELDEEGWHRAIGELIVPAYLAGDNPRAQSGHSGDERRWEGARRLVLEAVDRPGSFLDVGCANGHLMECVHAWSAENGIELEPWGLEISPELAALARERLPRWADRVMEGNALAWHPPRRFDYVRTNLDYVPASRRVELVARLLEEAVVLGGRLIVGAFNEEVETPAQQRLVESWGFPVTGSAERPHPDTDRLVRRAFWIDAR